jgi:hypothetical protein
VIRCTPARLWAAGLLVAAQTCAALAAAAQPPGPDPTPGNRPPFRVYDALLFRNKPDLGKLGLLPARGSGYELWATKQPGDTPDEPTIRREISPHQAFPGLWYIDLEQWPVYNIPDRDIEANISKLVHVADIVRQTAPKLQFGFYAIMPENVYWPLVAGTPGQLRGWRESARRTEVLARKVDVIMPSLYTFYDASPDDRAAWAKWASIVLTEARRYGKPVYPFLCPQFHDSNKQLGGQYLPPDYWRMELEVVHRYADGVVLWGGYEKSWDENAAWWQTTRSFLATVK